MRTVKSWNCGEDLHDRSALKRGNVYLYGPGEEDMNLKKIHHVAVIVSDYEKSRNFYVNILGFKIIRENYRPDRGDYKLDLELDGCELEIFSGRGNPPRPSYPEALGLRHLAFLVEDMETAVSELKEKGVDTEPVRTDEFTGKKMTFFHDPDGLPLELHE